MTEPPIRKRPFPWGKVMLGFLVTLILVVGGTWLSIDQLGKRRYRKAIEEAHSLGMPESFDQFRSTVTRAPDQDNFYAHPVLNELSLFQTEYLTLTNAASASRCLDPRLLFLDTEQSTDSMDEAEQQLLQTIAQDAELFQGVREAFACPASDQGSFDPVNQAPPSFDIARAGSFLKILIIADALKGEDEKAQKHLADLLRHSVAMTQAPNAPFFGNLFMQEASFRSLSHSLALLALEIEWNEELLQEMQRQVDSINLLSQFQQVCLFASLTNSQIRRMDSFEQIYEYEYEAYLPEGLKMEGIACLIEKNNRCHRLLTQERAITPELIKDIKELINHPVSTKLPAPQGYHDHLVDWIHDWSIYFGQAYQSYHSLRLAIALLRFKQAHEYWPERLDQLVPTYLPEVPEDITTSKPFAYQLSPDGLPRLEMNVPERPTTYWAPFPPPRSRRSLTK